MLTPGLAKNHMVTFGCVPSFTQCLQQVTDEVFKVKIFYLKSTLSPQVRRELSVGLKVRLTFNKLCYK